MKEAIDRALKRVKFEVNLVQQAASMDYEIDRKKGVRGAWITMKKGGDTILVLKEPNSNGYFYKSSIDEADKGTIVDFMLKRGYRFEEIIKLSNPYLGGDRMQYMKNKKEEKVINRDEAERLARDKYATYSYSRDNYLLKRGIDSEISKEMKVRTNKKGAIFSLSLANQMCSTIEYTERGKYFQASLPRGVCLLGEVEKPKNIVITESPIDALSYEQMRKEKKRSDCDSLYIVTCGSLANAVKKEILRLVDKHTHARVVLAFDNDEAGKKMGGKIKSMLTDRKTIVHKPTAGKDFNDMLKSISKGCHKKEG